MSFAPKIGNYRFSKNLGVGTFGKVKCNYFIILLFSGLQLSNWTQGGHKNLKQKKDQAARSF